MQADVKAFVELVGRFLSPGEPIVEFGSYQVPGQEGFADLRACFAGKRYLGCDIVTGPGVDRVEDLHQLSFEDASLGTVIAVETLEHVADPYVAIREIHRVLRPGGIAVLSMPFNFPIHHMPDYTRLTPEGMSRLLGDFRAHAVFSQGDAQHPLAIYGLALKSGNDSDAVQFEAAATRLHTVWNCGESPDPLVRFGPLVSVARWDAPDRRNGDVSLTRHIEQTFFCTHADLTRIDIKLDLRGSLNPATVRFKLTGDSGQELAALEVRTRYVPHERWVAFQFPAITASAGQQFRLALDCSDPATKITALTSTGSTLSQTTLLIDGQQRPGTLSFEAFCERRAAVAGVKVPPRDGEHALPAAEESVVLRAARVQAAELRYATALLHAEIVHLHDQLADVSGRLDHVSKRVVDELAETLRRYWPVRALLRLFGRSRT